MKITKNALRKIIREEVAKLSEQPDVVGFRDPDRRKKGVTGGIPETDLEKLRAAAYDASLSFDLGDRGGFGTLEKSGKDLSKVASGMIGRFESPLAASYNEIGHAMVDIGKAGYIIQDFVSAEFDGSNVEQLSDAAKHLESAARHAREALAKSK